MVKHYCEICDRELEAYRLAHEEGGTFYWQVGLRREKSDRHPREGVRYGEVCDTCMDSIRAHIDSLMAQGVEEQRQSRMVDRETEQTNCRAQLREVVDRNDGLDANYIWSEICNRSKDDEPTDKEIVYFTDHIDKHPGLWQKPKGENT